MDGPKPLRSVRTLCRRNRDVPPPYQKNNPNVNAIGRMAGEEDLSGPAFLRTMQPCLGIAGRRSNDER